MKKRKNCRGAGGQEGRGVLWRVVIVWVLFGGYAAWAEDEVLLTALKAVGLQKEDLTIRSDTLNDPDRLFVTRYLLENPSGADVVLDELGGESVEDGLRWAVALMGLGSERDTLATDTPITLDDLVDELVQCQARVEAIYAGFHDEERARLADLIALVDPNVLLAEGQKDSLIVLGRRVDVGALVQVTQRLMAAVECFVAGNVKLVPGQFETSAGLVIVGTEGDDVYDVPAVLIIDLGGNDRYENVAGVASWVVPISVCIDMAGDDVYTGHQGVGVLGIGVLVDLVGDDGYEGSGSGAGIAGVGIVNDRAGDEQYQTVLGGQGFGIYGLGLLCDGGGSDRYVGGLLVQGAAGPGGGGILLDVMGNDVYDAGGVYRDFREEGTFFQSMSQGFGRGVRPLTSGGVGLLVDGGGDDVYRVDYFGQGAAFWGGTGLLIDRDGRDTYAARRYAQGAGVHMAVGVLLDVLGDDVYDVWGVGQGCGHDLAVGLLFDREGDDAYRATWLGQGAGSANGVGWLDDREGADRYVVGREDAQGYGVLSRDYGSIGLVIDRVGVDVYEGRGANGSLWRGGYYGVGVDWPLKEKDLNATTDEHR